RRHQFRLVGGRRDQVLSRRGYGFPLDLRYWHRRLLRGRLRLGRWRPVRHVLDPIPWPAPGAAAGWPVPFADALRHVPLAHRGSDSLSERPAHHSARPGLAWRRALLATPMRHRVGSVLVSGAAYGGLSTVA